MLLEFLLRLSSATKWATECRAQGKSAPPWVELRLVTRLTRYSPPRGLKPLPSGFPGVCSAGAGANGRRRAALLTTRNNSLACNAIV